MRSFSRQSVSRSNPHRGREVSFTFPAPDGIGGHVVAIRGLFHGQERRYGGSSLVQFALPFRKSDGSSTIPTSPGTRSWQRVSDSIGSPPYLRPFQLWAAAIKVVANAECSPAVAQNAKDAQKMCALQESIFKLNELRWCPETELNRRHADFQSAALPTELSGHALMRG